MCVRLSLPYFIAAKWDAFQSRGGGDPRLSHDFEDIAWLLDQVEELPQLVEQADPLIRYHLQEIIGTILRRSEMLEAIEANMEYTTRARRFQLLKERLMRV